MKELFLFICLSLLGFGIADSTAQEVANQRPDSVVQVLPEQDSAVVVDSVELGLLEPEPPAIVDSLLRELEKQHALLSGRFDSLLKANETLEKKARRRLDMDLYVDSFRGYHFYACAVAPERIQIQLFNPEGRRKLHTFSSVSELAEDKDMSLVFAMNAGMYERDRSAKGLFIAEGKLFQPLDTLTSGYGNFYMQPNGVFLLDSNQHAYVLTTQEYHLMADSLTVVNATQSGPMMLVDGDINPLFNDGSPNRYIRNAVGVTPHNEVVFAISVQPVTFFEMSSFLLQQGCHDALYLDGAISKIYAPELGIQNLEAGNHLGPIIAIWGE